MNAVAPAGALVTTDDVQACRHGLRRTLAKAPMVKRTPQMWAEVPVGQSVAGALALCEYCRALLFVPNSVTLERVIVCAL